MQQKVSSFRTLNAQAFQAGSISDKEQRETSEWFTFPLIMDNLNADILNLNPDGWMGIARF